VPLSTILIVFGSWVVLLGLAVYGALSGREPDQ